MLDFSLDARLANDCAWVGDLSLCRVLLLKDANYPWLILVPMVNACREIIDLSSAQQQLLWQESAHLSQVLQVLFKPDKLNVAALGNVVAQLHVHHIVRYQHDIAWPKPVWGQHPAKNYESSLISERVEQIARLLKA